MTRSLIAAASLTILLLPASSPAITIDITLSPTSVQSLGPITFTVGVQSDIGNPVDINGYTLDYAFDDTRLSFLGATQLVDFGDPPVEDFLPIGDCTSGRCSAGNTPDEDAFGVLSLFELEFDVLSPFDDGTPILTVGILDELFDGVTQATGDPAFDEGDVVAMAFIPEPHSAALLTWGLCGLASLRRARGRSGHSRNG